MNMSPGLLGFFRGLLVVVIFAGLKYIENVTNLNGVVPNGIATLIATGALALEHYMSAGTSTALFGSVYKK